MDMEIVNSMLVWGFGEPCPCRWFCSTCRGRSCIICCPDHTARHHGGAGAGVLGIHMVKDMPAVLARQVKVSSLGFDWRRIHRKNVSGQKKIFIHRQPADRRLKSTCKTCDDPVRARSDYCSPACKVLHKPNGQNAEIIQDLVHTDFAQEPLRDRFCLTCLRAFASTHCADHGLHLHGADGEEAGAAPVVLEIMEYNNWKLVPADVVGPWQHLLKRINVNGIQMIAVRRRHMQDAQGANACANFSCNESVDEIGDVCCIECLFDLQVLLQGEEGEEEEEED